MFEWGFWEMVLIAVIALVVIGPERLPKVARIAGLWIGRARRTLSSVKDEIDRELRTEELRQTIEKQARLDPIKTIADEVTRKDAPASGETARATEAAKPTDTASESSAERHS